MDTISTFLTRIRNAQMAGHEKVDMPSSKIQVCLAQILKQEGYVRHFKTVKDNKQGMMRVYLKYDEAGKPLITQIDRVSRPGLRVYVGADKIPQVMSGYGLAVLSTNQGLLSGREAQEKKIGGEVLCTVW